MTNLADRMKPTEWLYCYWRNLYHVQRHSLFSCQWLHPVSPGSCQGEKALDLTCKPWAYQGQAICLQEDEEGSHTETESPVQRTPKSSPAAAAKSILGQPVRSFKDTSSEQATKNKLFWHIRHQKAFNIGITPLKGHLISDPIEPAEVLNKQFQAGAQQKENLYPTRLQW